MQIRALVPANAAAYQALRLRGLQECPEAFASSYEEEVVTPIAEIARRLEPREGSAIFGSFQEATLCAIVGRQRENMMKLAHKAFMWGSLEQDFLLVGGKLYDEYQMACRARNPA